MSGNQTAIKKALGQNIGLIARHDLATGNIAAATAAEAALHQVNAVSSQTSGNAVLTGSKWDSAQVVTWSMADSAGTSAAPFSDFMDSSSESTVQDAFAAWSKASGLTFKEVKDSAQSDVRIGWGDFDTTQSAVVGYTSSTANNGLFNPDTIVRLEDPNQDPLSTGADGQPTYGGTQATLYQTLLHEIGHALGLASNSDPTSIMNYQLTANNRTLDGTDIAGVKAIYSPEGSTNGAEKDVYAFDTALSSAPHVESISDFMAGFDKIALDKNIFTELKEDGVLSSDFFRASVDGAAVGEHDYILYNTTSGALYYDADGNGQGAAVEFATLTTKPTVSSHDFMIASLK